MSTKRKPAAAKAAKADIAPAPEGPVDLLTLTEAQANQLTQALAQAQAAKARADELAAKVQELLAFIAPPGANGFDMERMTFQSVPAPKPQD